MGSDCQWVWGNKIWGGVTKFSKIAVIVAQLYEFIITVELGHFEWVDVYNYISINQFI